MAPRTRWELPRIWLDPSTIARHLSDDTDRRTQIYRTIDRGGFDWQVFIVAASGFLTDSYNLFATNIILPAIAYIYWPGVDGFNGDQKGRWEVAINVATLGGSVIGQLLFGYLADRFGRRKLYGLELIIVIVSTLGLTQASSGFYDQKHDSTSMNIQAWLIFYRLLQGIGIGGEYPMSAVITAEFASVHSRARMMAAVFLMQPLGQLLAAIIGVGVVVGYSGNSPDVFGPNMNSNTLTMDDAQLLAYKVQIDKIWRWVIGVGAIPAFLAILFRLTIPESPRYTLDVDEDATRALQDALHYYDASQSTFATQPTNRRDSIGTAESAPDDPTALHHRGNHPSRRLSDLDGVSPRESPAGSIIEEPAPEPTVQDVSFFRGFRDYLFGTGSWRWLLGASLAWFILDFAFYGLGVNNPRTVAKMWAATKETNDDVYQTSWNSEIDIGSILSNDGNNIFYVLRNDALRSIITSTLGSLIGSIIIIQIIPYVPRKTMLTWTFLLLSVLMIVTGGVLLAVFETDAHAVVITLYVIIQLIFNLGPNTLLFIYPAEIFPTKYRGTCYGIASAAGKLAACIVQAILPFATFGTNHPVNREKINNAWALSWLWIVWGLLMVFGAFFSWLWLPEVQKPRSEGLLGNGFKIPSKTLEEMAGGRGSVNEPGDSFARRRLPFFTKENNSNGRARTNGIVSH